MAAPTIQEIVEAKSTTTVTSLSASFAATPNVNSAICVFVFSSVNHSAMTISDNQGNTIGAAVDSDGYAAIWGKQFLYKAATSSGTFTITVNQNSGYLRIAAISVNGWNSSTSPEKHGKLWQTISSSNSPYSPLNFTATTAAEQLFLSSIACENGLSRTYGAGTGWTLEKQYTASDSLGYGLISKSVTSTGTYDPEFTVTGGSTNTMMLGISIISGSEGSGGGGGGFFGRYYYDMIGKAKDV